MAVIGGLNREYERVTVLEVRFIAVCGERLAGVAQQEESNLFSCLIHQPVLSSDHRIDGPQGNDSHSVVIQDSAIGLWNMAIFDSGLFYILTEKRSKK